MYWRSTPLNFPCDRFVNCTFVNALERSNVPSVATQLLLDDGQFLYLNKCQKWQQNFLKCQFLHVKFLRVYNFCDNNFELFFYIFFMLPIIVIFYNFQFYSISCINTFLIPGSGSPNIDSIVIVA